MTARKWGESFLKSGLPLEHLTQVTLRDLGWSCTAQAEFHRPNREAKESWFELDLTAHSHSANRDTDLMFLVECKYHDTSRYWFFLPHVVAGRWQFDDRVLNCAPYQTLRKPRDSTILKSAPLSAGGIVISEDGTKQDNAVYAAVQQLVNGFVPFALSLMFTYNIDFHNVADESDELEFVPTATAMIPVLVTNAKLYRLRESVTDLDAIRSASAPSDIADELEWTWYYYDPPMSLCDQNLSAIEAHRKLNAELVYRFPGVDESMDRLVDSRPNWIAIINIRALAKAAAAIEAAFLAVPTVRVDTFLKPRRNRPSRRGRPTRS